MDRTKNNHSATIHFNGSLAGKEDGAGFAKDTEQRQYNFDFVPTDKRLVEFCMNCTQPDCDGECEAFFAYVEEIRRQDENEE